MKRILLLLLITLPFAAVGQYGGGVNDGVATGSSTSQNAIPNIFTGGSNDGVSSGASLNQNPIPNIFKGGTDDGVAIASVLNQNAIPNIFQGGVNDGVAFASVTSQNSIPAIYAGGINDGVAFASALIQNSTPAIYTGGLNDGVASAVALNSNAIPAIYLGGGGDGFSFSFALNQNKSVPTILEFKLDAKVLLQGPMGASVMTTTLNTSGLLPKTQPYTTSPFSYFGTEAVTTMPSNVTDWVMIELRDPVTPATLIARRVGLMLNTGDIKDVDGASPISFTGVPAGNYYVAVKSRNSLPIRSAGTMNFSVATTTSYDFTTSLSKAYNVAGANTQMVLINGKWCLWTADVNGDGSIDGSDFNTVDNEVTNGTFGYIPQDVNMDGVVDGTDFNYTDANTAQGLFYTPN